MKKIGLTFGVNLYDPNYYGPGNNLGECENDATRMSRRLAVYGFGVTQRNSETATRNEFFKALYEAATQLTEGDTFALYFSGHGTYDDYIPAKKKTPVRATAICLHDSIVWDGEILNYLSTIKKGVTVIWITDCCHAESNYRTPRPEGVREKYTQPKAEEWSKVTPPSQGSTRNVKCAVIALNSSRASEVSLELENIGGLFTDRLLTAELLRVVTTYGDLEREVLKNMPPEWGQHPVFSHVKCAKFRSRKLF